MIREVIRSIEISKHDLISSKIEATDAAIVHGKPSSETMCGLAVRRVENREDQMNEEITVTEDQYAVFGLPFLVTMPGEQFCQKLLCA